MVSAKDNDQETLDDLKIMFLRITLLDAEYSSDAIIITINTEQVHFEHTEESIEMR